MMWTLSKQTLRACAFFSLCAISSLAQAVSINIPNVTATPGTATLPVEINITGGNENIQGLEFALEVVDPAGKITVTSLNLRPPNGLFSDIPSFLMSIRPPDGTQVRPGEYRDILQQLVIFETDPRTFAHINGSKTLAIANLKLDNPLPGTYLLRSRQTTTGFITKVADDSQDNAIIDNLEFTGGSITVVPEPSTILMAGLAGLGLVVYGFRRRAA